MNGLLIVDKPAGMTSHDVVAVLRRLAQERSVGHLGTLDPLATGVLPLMLGRMTRLAQFYLQAQKSYEGEIRFGWATDTYDADGEPLGTPSAVRLTLEQVREAAARFMGDIEQMPPPFSAKKVRGVPAYKLARKKKPVALAPVKVRVEEFTLLALEGERARFRIRVGSGAYVRALAHDLGQALGVGAHLAGLRRTAVGEFDISQAHPLEELESAAPAGSLESLLVHPRRILPDLPAVTATDEALGRIRHGNPVNLPEMSRARQVKVFYGQNQLIAIATRVAGTLFQPKVVLVDSSSR